MNLFLSGRVGSQTSLHGPRDSNIGNAPFVDNLPFDHNPYHTLAYTHARGHPNYENKIFFDEKYVQRLESERRRRERVQGLKKKCKNLFGRVGKANTVNCVS